MARPLGALEPEKWPPPADTPTTRTSISDSVSLDGSVSIDDSKSISDDGSVSIVDSAPVSPILTEPTLYVHDSREKDIPRVTTKAVECRQQQPRGDEKDGDICKPLPSPIKRTPRSALSRLGTANVCYVALAAIVELLILAFLIFLWNGIGPEPDASRANGTWRRVVLSGWAPQVVTLSAMALRIAISLQGGVCTGLVASLMLERSEVRFADVPFVTMLRAVMAGPSTFSTALYRDPRMLLRSRIAMVMALFCLDVVAGQFMSTLLFSDFRETRILGETRQFPVASVSLDGQIGDLFGTHLWASPPRTYPSFGEEEGQSVTTGSDFVDTGVIHRSLLPFNATDRQYLRRYEGLAIGLNTQVACIRPSFSNLTISVPPLGVYGTEYATASGDVWWNEESANKTGMNDAAALKPSSFYCYVPLLFAQGSAQGALPPPTAETYFCFLYQTERGGGGVYTGVGLIFSGHGVLRTPSSWDASKTNTFTPSASNSSEWVQLGLEGAVPNASYDLSVTMCGFSAKYLMENVTLKGEADPVEPSISYNVTGLTPEAVGVMRLAGAGPYEPATHAERGILSIVKSAVVLLSPSLNNSLFMNPDILSDLGMLWFNNFSPSGVLLYLRQYSVPHIDTNYSVLFRAMLTGSAAAVQEAAAILPHPSWSALYYSIFNATGSPATAIERVFFWSIQESYYDTSLPVANAGVPATVAYSTSKSFPLAWNGLVAVAVIVAVNLACAVAIIAAFLTESRHSLPGQSWQAAAQLFSRETEPILWRATFMTDAEVAARLKERGTEASGMDFDRPSGRMSVVVGYPPRKSIDNSIDDSIV